jgi:hypothetical protein
MEIRLLFNVKEEDINLRFHIPKSLIPYLALIVAKKNVKNGKNNLDKKNKERMNIINANKRSSLNKLKEKCKVIKISLIIKAGNIMSMGLIEEGKETKDTEVVVVVVLHTPRPHILRASIRAIIILLITSKCWKNRLIFRPKR